MGLLQVFACVVCVRCLMKDEDPRRYALAQVPISILSGVGRNDKVIIFQLFRCVVSFVSFGRFFFEFASTMKPLIITYHPAGDPGGKCRSVSSWV